MVSSGCLTIDLSNIRANWRFLNEKLGADAVCGAVVKADAYGLGVAPVANALQAEGCTQFFVVTLDEAIELRAVIGEQPEIYVLGGLSHGLGAEWVEYRLVPVLFDIAHLYKWHEFCQERNESLPCVLKLDTGMHRLGIEPKKLIAELAMNPALKQLCPTFVMTHLACADTPAHPLNQQQYEMFARALVALKDIWPSVKASVCNSSGIFLGSNYHFDLARPGISIYGGNPQPDAANPMLPVVTLSLPVKQIKVIELGETVGYGGTFVANRITRLAIVFGGYADGLLRSLSNKAQGWVEGQAVPLVGRVSMDSLVFDITELRSNPESIEVLNSEQTIDDLAASGDTISYEILTSLGSRYQRFYEGGQV